MVGLKFWSLLIRFGLPYVNISRQVYRNMYLVLTGFLKVDDTTNLSILESGTEFKTK